MRRQRSKVELLTARVNEQRAWVKRCGGTLEGYIKTYGDRGQAKCAGSGGTAIFTADMNELIRLQDLLSEAIEKEIVKLRRVYNDACKVIA